MRRGNVAFSFDITRLLRERPNELVVARSTTAAAAAAQAASRPTTSAKAVFTRAPRASGSRCGSKAVGSSFVESFSIVPDPDHSRVLIEAAVNGADSDLTLTAEAFADGKMVGKDSCAGVVARQPAGAEA